MVMFLLTPYQGHLNATLVIASQYSKMGSVIFVGPPHLQNQVESSGWRYHVLALQYFKTPVNVKRFWNALLNIFTPQKQRSEFFAECNELRSLLYLFMPDIVYIDAFMTVFYPVVKEIGIRCAVVQTTLPTQKSNAVPPLNSGVIPNCRWSSGQKIRLLWQKRLFYNWSSNLILRLYSVNRFHIDLMKRLKGYSKSDYNFQTLMVPTIISIPEIVIATSAFDFCQYQKLNNQIFTGLNIYQRVEKKDPRLLRFISSAREHSGEIIYCSFGTIIPEQSRHVSTFFTKLFNIAKYANWFLIIKSSEIKNCELIKNVYAADELPQLFILQQSTIMISHGGLNSINECIFHEVPMLIYPIDNNSDRPGNAARVAFHRIGLRGELSHETKKGLRAKIDRLLGDNDFRTNIRTIKNRGIEQTTEFGVYFKEKLKLREPVDNPDSN